MKNSIPTKSSGLRAYIAATTTCGLAAVPAHAATVVTSFAPGDAKPFTVTFSPATITPGPKGIPKTNPEFGRIEGNGTARIAFDNVAGRSFTTGADLGPPTGSFTSLGYTLAGSGSNGATISSPNGALNFANISLDGDAIYESVALFRFTGTGGGEFLAIATNDDGTPLSISQGAAAINAVPEVSSLSLLALGSAGLLARRKRQAA